MIKKIRTILCGDLHGCIDSFNELLTKLDFNQNTDRLILCGDLIDRGPDSIGCIRKARELKLESVMGNHEEKLLKWWAGNRKKPIQDYYSEITEDDISYISKFPYYIKLDENSYVVHAGIKPNVNIENQTKHDLAHLRFTDKERLFISLRKIVNGQAPNAMFWTEFGPYNVNVVYGHHVHSLENIKIDRYENSPYACYGIDNGCAFGGNLTALIWDTKEVVQVKAKQEYCKLGF